jgi:hypothetical protein
MTATDLDTLLIALMHSEDERLPPQALIQLMHAGGLQDHEGLRILPRSQVEGLHNL